MTARSAGQAWLAVARATRDTDPCSQVWLDRAPTGGDRRLWRPLRCCCHGCDRSGQIASRPRITPLWACSCRSMTPKRRPRRRYPRSWPTASAHAPLW